MRPSNVPKIVTSFEDALSYIVLIEEMLSWVFNWSNLIKVNKKNWFTYFLIWVFYKSITVIDWVKPMEIKVWFVY